MIRRLTESEKKHEYKKRQQMKARQIEAKVKWQSTRAKICPVCDNSFLTLDYEVLACSHECARELRKCQT